MKSNSLAKLYLIPITLSNPGETTVVPEDVLPQTIKRTIDFIDYYIVENRSDRFEHIPIPQMPASGILLRPKENPYPPEPEEIILEDKAKPSIPKGIISIFNIFSYIGAAINDVFNVAGQKQNICEICDKKLHHTYKTININEDNVPEIVKFCSIKCMDSHEEYEFE